MQQHKPQFIACGSNRKQMLEKHPPQKLPMPYYFSQLGMRLAFEHLPGSKAVRLGLTMCLDAFLRRILWMTYFTPAEVPEVRWRVRAPLPRPTEYHFTLRNSLDEQHVKAAGFRLPLKPAQECTLGWMLKQEAGVPFRSEQRLFRPMGA